MVTLEWILAASVLINITQHLLAYEDKGHYKTSIELQNSVKDMWKEAYEIERKLLNDIYKGVEPRKVCTTANETFQGPFRTAVEPVLPESDSERKHGQ